MTASTAVMSPDEIKKIDTEGILWSPPYDPRFPNQNQTRCILSSIHQSFFTPCFKILQLEVEIEKTMPKSMEECWKLLSWLAENRLKQSILIKLNEILTKTTPVLALHGYRQSDKIFYTKLGSLRKYFKKEIEFVFVRAPHTIPPDDKSSSEETAPDDAEETEKFGWWFNTEDRTFKATEPSNSSIGFDESVKLIEQTFEDKGPFDGVLGFSQGASFVSILCAMMERKILQVEFDFAIIISGFKSLCKPHETYYGRSITLPTLHVYGSGDKVIPTKMAEALSDVFVNKKLVVHEGGHYVPGKKHMYHDFVKECLEKKNAKVHSL
ncbi:hypothetical protein QAD02_006450 [Eretmocerus hayati]|uniref:Uncharacterized protein n=1 Tax=Eretmocerus hayati TaxID=131215 RepID=A0ACC2N208_9HYME|nr:hypothetical protein QAD02_006450 [Eretmocerus hayati]